MRAREGGADERLPGLLGAGGRAERRGAADSGRHAGGRFQVWTKRVGNNPDLKVLLLHGGPGATHEYLEACDSFLPAAGIEYYYYDQLGSGFSDQPDDPSLWELDRFVDEVEQVRLALGLDRGNFVLYGQSWGGILAMEYALTYQRHLRGLVISNMMASAPAYNAYAEQVLMPPMDQAVLAEMKALEAAGDIENPRYMELLMPHYYEHHMLRMPAADWPDPVVRGFAHINQKIYVPMQGPSELGIAPTPSWPTGTGSRPGPDRGAGAGHRRPLRHHGPRAHGDDGRPPAPGPVPALPGRQPPGHVRRPGHVLRGPYRLPARPARALMAGQRPRAARTSETRVPRSRPGVARAGPGRRAGLPVR